MAHIRKLPPTAGARTFRYQVRYIDARGKERAKTFPNRDAASRFLHDAETAKRSGEKVSEPTHQTLDQWFEQFVGLQGWRESTVLQQRSRYSLHISPALGHYLLSEVSTQDVKRLIRSWERSTMSHSTLRACVSLLRSVFAVAVDEDVLATSPASEVRARRAAQPKRHTVLSMEQVAQLRAAMPTGQHRAFLDLLAGTGIRLGEGRSLTIDRLDLDASPATVTIDRQLLPGRASSSPASFGGVKGKSIPSRTIGITAELAGVLREQVGERSTQSFVFESSHFAGRAMGARSLTEVWQRAMDRAGLDRVSFPGWHSLRHHHASRLLSSRAVSLAAVQYRLGHSSAGVTLGVYTHAWESGEDQILSVLG